MKAAPALHPVVLVVVVMALAGIACQAVTGPVVNPPTGSQPGSDVLFYDDFSDRASGWDRESYDGGQTDYLDGTYRILVTESNADYWANPGLDFGDVRIEVEARKADGPDDNDFGVICRYQDIDNFYYLIASSDGYAGILKHKDGESQPLEADSLVASDAILQGNATNRLQADCIGSTLTLYVNGEQVVQVTDSDFSRGDVGLIAGTFDIPGTDIRFDEFRVSVP